jgi:hypothetical protein
MACQGIVKKKVQVMFLLLVLFLNIPLHAYALDDQIITFSKNREEQTIGFINGSLGSVSVSRTTGTSSFNFDIYDCNDNLIKSGFFQGQLPKDEKLYPLRIKINANASDDYMVECKITYVADTGNIENLIKMLDGDLLKKLDELKQKLDGILEDLRKINDYLSNPAYLNKGVDDMKNAVNHLSKNPVSDVNSTASTLGGLTGGSGGSGDFEIPLEIGGQKFNAFNVDALSGQLELIKGLMKSIIWIEFAVFCIRVVVPKFKV